MKPDLRFFEYEHLPTHLQDISKPFKLLAIEILEQVEPSDETTTFLRKLLEAKDCAVRAALPKR